jgi:hypothetical protein
VGVGISAYANRGSTNYERAFAELREALVVGRPIADA